ncbi:MAG: DUF4493 domain-containing protein [Bacteroidales bacterium]|nr:DUF4493 domain-containing protein [Bacteroidales bacterium]
MKRLNLNFNGAVALAAVMVSLCGCDALWSDDISTGMDLSFDESTYLTTKANAEIPDTNRFILSVKDAAGKVVYDGKYGDSPERIMVSPGSYTVSVKSGEFGEPRFDSPLYGDTQVVAVAGTAPASVHLLCHQLNAGVRLRIAPDFLKSFPNGSLFLKSSDGKLLYSYSEKRIAYFRPGSVSLMLSNNGKDEILMSRVLEAQDVLQINVSAPESSGAEKISIQVDTSRNWRSENFVIGGGADDGGDTSSALSVAEARKSAGLTGVWVRGYIVGGDLSSSNASFKSPFSSRTNILLGPRSSSTDKSTCLSVQLKQGSVRDALNLVDNPGLLGREVFLKGDLVESYYGIPGIQNITELKLLP